MIWKSCAKGTQQYVLCTQKWSGMDVSNPKQNCYKAKCKCVRSWLKQNGIIQKNFLATGDRGQAALLRAWYLCRFVYDSQSNKIEIKIYKGEDGRDERGIVWNSLQGNWFLCFPSNWNRFERWMLCMIESIYPFIVLALIMLWIALIQDGIEGRCKWLIRWFSSVRRWYSLPLCWLMYFIEPNGSPAFFALFYCVNW